MFFFFFSSRRRHTRWNCDWSSDVCSSDLRVAYQEKFFDVPILAQRHDCSGDKIRRTEITAHCIQGDLHRKQILRALVALCKIKFESRARRASYPLPSTVRTWRPL